MDDELPQGACVTKKPVSNIGASFRQWLLDLRAGVSGNERADADVVVGIHGDGVEYNPVSGKICVWLPLTEVVVQDLCSQ